MSDHYFAADPAVEFRRTRFAADVWGHRLELTSGSGVFSNATARLTRER